jgi:cytochrome P450
MVKFNPFDGEFHRDPYPTYHSLRQQEPIVWSHLGVWVLTRYEEVKIVLSDPRFGSVNIPEKIANKSRYLAKKQRNLDHLRETSQHFLFFLNPPDHTKLRRLCSQAFTTETWQRLTPLIAQLANQNLDRVSDQGSMDFMADFADRLPGQVIAHLLGLPETDCPRLHDLATLLFRLFDPMMTLKASERVNESAIAFSDYLRDQIEWRRKKPTDDLLSTLLAVGKADDSLTEAEVISLVIMLFIAGEQTSSALLGNGLLALLHHRDQMNLLREKPELLPAAVEEMMRYDSPTQLIVRVALEPVILGNQRIAAGDNLVLCLGAANRDTDRFLEPDRLNILREDNRHLAFAGGIHFCIGAGLARLEANIAFKTILERLASIDLPETSLEWRENIVLRSLQSLPITFQTSG